MSTDRRIHAVRVHLAAYEKQGGDLRAEQDEITRARAMIDSSPAVLLTFGSVWRRSSAVPYQFDPNGMRILLGVADRLGGEDSVDGHVHRGRVRASEIAYPGLKACLLMWLNEWEARMRGDLAAWEARDPVAEAAALPVPAEATAPPPTPAPVAPKPPPPPPPPKHRAGCQCATCVPF
jgi:hypothetical protein